MNLLPVFAILLVLAVAAFYFRRQLAAGARTIGGAAGGNFFQNHGWLIVSAIVIPVGYFMFTGGMAQTLAAIAAITVAIFALNLLMSNPPSSWVFAATVALLLLFVSWDPTWRYVENAKNWWIGDLPAQTVEEAESRIPILKGNRLTVPPGGEVMYRLDHVVHMPDHACHDLHVSPPGVFGLTRGNGSYTLVSPPVIGEYTTITVRSVTPAGNPAGC